jgi:hypothetical protein
MLTAMAGGSEISLPQAMAYRIGPLADTLQGLRVTFSPGGGGDFIAAWSWIVALFAVACFLPNTQQIMARVEPALPAAVELVRGGWLGRLLAWRPSPVWAVASGVALAMGILSLSQVSEFLYFQF